MGLGPIKRKTSQNNTAWKRRRRCPAVYPCLFLIGFLVSCTGPDQAHLTRSIPAEKTSPTTIHPIEVRATEPSLPEKTTKPPQTTPSEEGIQSEYGEAFGIDYAHPSLYLRQGEQSRISDSGFLPDLSTGKRGLEELREIYAWMKREFTPYRAGGKTIGTVTVEELFARKTLGGCHDHALLFSAVVRTFGYPAVIIETYSISWMEEYQRGTSQGYEGHVFVEVYLEDQWILVDPTYGWYVAEGYDPVNPFIPLTGKASGPSLEEDGFLVDLKGIDSWDMGIHSVADLNLRMESTAAQFNLAGMDVPSYTFEHF